MEVLPSVLFSGWLLWRPDYRLCCTGQFWLSAWLTSVAPSPFHLPAIYLCVHSLCSSRGFKQILVVPFVQPLLCLGANRQLWLVFWLHLPVYSCLRSWANLQQAEHASVCRYFTYFQRTLVPQVIAAFTPLFHPSLNSMLLHQRFLPRNTNDAPSYYSKTHGPSAHLAKSCDMYVQLHVYCLYIALEYKLLKRWSSFLLTPSSRSSCLTQSTHSINIVGIIPSHFTEELLRLDA